MKFGILEYNKYSDYNISVYYQNFGVLVGLSEISYKYLKDEIWFYIK